MPSRTEPPVAVVACGALAGDIRRVVATHRWPVEVHALPAVLHNRPDRIAAAVEEVAGPLLAAGTTVVVAYADCGTYGALDEVCDRLGLRRLPGLHCYDVIAGERRMRAVFAAEPGTYVLTDYLVRSFDRTVLAGLGLDQRPELLADYFAHYTRVVWLAQRPNPDLRRQAERAAGSLGLPLETVYVGDSALADRLAGLLRPTPTPVGATR